MDKKKREVIEWLMDYAAENRITPIQFFNAIYILFPNDLEEIREISVELIDKEKSKKMN